MMPSLNSLLRLSGVIEFTQSVILILFPLLSIFMHINKATDIIFTLQSFLESVQLSLDLPGRRHVTLFGSLQIFHADIVVSFFGYELALLSRSIWTLWIRTNADGFSAATLPIQTNLTPTLIIILVFLDSLLNGNCRDF